MVSVVSTQAPDTLWARLDDEAGREAWMAAHDFRHRTYRKAASRRGSFLQPAILTGKIDADWFFRHAMTHLSLKRLFPVEVGQSIPSLVDAELDSQASFEDWMRQHALIHARLDTALGVV